MAFWSKKDNPESYTASMVELAQKDMDARMRSKLATTGTLGGIGVRPTALGTPSPSSILGFDVEVLHHVANLLHQNNMTQQDLLEVVDTYMKVKRRADNG